MAEPLVLAGKKYTKMRDAFIEGELWFREKKFMGQTTAYQVVWFKGGVAVWVRDIPKPIIHAFYRYLEQQRILAEKLGGGEASGE